MDKIEVTQADIDAWEIYGPKIFHCEMTGPEALAAHRLATRTDATPVAWMYKSKWLPQPECRLDRREVVPRGYRETPLYTHPPATDVAAVVEAAKWALAELRGKNRYDNPQQALDRFDKADAALAPFTEGPKP